jgi:elongation factor P hydroxylase
MDSADAMEIGLQCYFTNFGSQLVNIDEHPTWLRATCIITKFAKHEALIWARGIHSSP